MSSYVLRYAGPRWSIFYGSYTGPEAYAIEELNRSLQSFLPYLVQVNPAAAQPALPKDQLNVLIGTPSSNAWIERFFQGHLLTLPDNPQGFVVRLTASPWDPPSRLLVIAAREPQGLVHGVMTLIGQVLAPLLPAGDCSPLELRGKLDNLPDFHISQTPAIIDRGIWSWGYVLYDYPAFLDKMARLRMNSLTLWNDVPPLNAPQLIEEAHRRGIRLILGFPWGWGMEYDLASTSDRELIREEVLAHYHQHIAPLKADGIYFQTLTEHDKLDLDGHSVAALACELVNDVSARLLAEDPALEIQFGLHATSIRERFHELDGLDPRVTIVWEDAGATPYTYTPAAEWNGMSLQQTLERSLAMAAARPQSTFGLVPKGWTNLDWGQEFEHHAGFLLGTRSKGAMSRRMHKADLRWAEVNHLWQPLYAPTTAFYRALAQATHGRMTVQGLIEDGLLEHTLQPSVAMFGEILWDPFRSAEVLLKAADNLLEAERI